MNEQIKSLMLRAVEDGIFPSAQLLVAKAGHIIIDEPFGNATGETIFDVASLTKPISTTTLLMQLVAEDKIRLDDTLQQLIPQCQCEAKTNITVRHLLSHSSGLPAWQPFYQTIPTDDIGEPSGKMQIIDACCREPLIYTPGQQSIYSDLGFILLGEIIESVTKMSISKVFNEKVATPLSLNNTFFVPLTPSLSPQGRGLGEGASFAPTEDCPWRNKVMRGEVHDQNCYAMGGVAGHAGLFSTTADIHKFLKVFVESFKTSGSFLHHDTVQRFLPFHYKLTDCNSTWLLGWDTPAHGNSQAGEYFSHKSIGHLGYTGCSMWIDLEKEIWIILLTNRIHPTSTNEKIKSFRPMIYNEIFEEVL
jgi:CubicO group peptidase (beta-lactamase class C family)